MRKLLSIVSTHWRQDFAWNSYLAILLQLCVSLFINYSTDLENSWIDPHKEIYLRLVLYFLLYGSGYYLACLIVFRFNQQNKVWRSKKFWLFTGVGLLILSLDKGFPVLTNVIERINLPYEIYAWLFRIASNINSFLFTLLPLGLFYLLADREKSGLYGLTIPSDVKPYLRLLLIVAPFIFLAATQNDFTNYYPVYKSNSVAQRLQWPSYLPMLLFEFFYGIDFLNVELLFRGFFVIGISQILGKHAILPMVVIYCYLHFGKPVGEAISSIAGGYVLGVIAFYTRSIWGGIVIHVGVAWLMELAAYTIKQF